MALHQDAAVDARSALSHENSVPGGGDGVQRWQVEEARRLYRAERCRRPETLLSRRRPGLTVDEAYGVQWCGAGLRMGAGARVVGHKVGLTSAAMQQQIGIGEPDFGVLLDSMIVAPDGVLWAGDLLAPRIEAEIAFRLGADVGGAEVTDQDVRAAVAEVFLALEVIDSRFELAGITVADSVADNAGAARCVLGAPSSLPEWDLRDERLTVCVGTREVATGEGRDILGDPLRSVSWLARRLHVFGMGLAAGEVVLAGAVHASLPLPVGQTVSVRSPRLPSVSLHIAPDHGD
ncbi:2-keto-4-pentenoate hydratase [Saccharopolyspora taberi]|uniref:Fumarylacetoacetate hydrolase family protein n=1 Tax=Saccharopolyspora taberi TaxID=60895 RepID=A0ABN3VI10_9PSEU